MNIVHANLEISNKQGCLPADAPVPAYREVEYRSEKWQEDDQQNPDDLVIAMEIIHQGRNQCQQGKKEY